MLQQPLPSLFGCPVSITAKLLVLRYLRMHNSQRTVKFRVYHKTTSANFKVTSAITLPGNVI